MSVSDTDAGRDPHTIHTQSWRLHGEPDSQNIVYNTADMFTFQLTFFISLLTL